MHRDPGEWRHGGSILPSALSERGDGGGDAFSSTCSVLFRFFLQLEKKRRGFISAVKSCRLSNVPAMSKYIQLVFGLFSRTGFCPNTFRLQCVQQKYTEA